MAKYININIMVPILKLGQKKDIIYYDMNILRYQEKNGQD